MGSQVDADNFKMSTRNIKDGRTDGVAVDDSFNDGLVAVANGHPSKSLDPSTVCEFFDDFIGDNRITDGTDRWLITDTSALGAPTTAIVDDGDGGQFELTLASTSESEIIDLTWGDNLSIEPTKGPIMTVRANVAVAVAASQDLVIGLGSARNDTLDSVASNAWFRLAASMSLLLESDDGTTDNDDQDSTVDLTAATWYDFKIDATTRADVKFYYRTALTGDWTALTVAGTTFALGTGNLQPIIQLQKSTGAGVPSVLIDYVQVLWRR